MKKHSKLDYSQAEILKKYTKDPSKFFSSKIEVEIWVEIGPELAQKILDQKHTQQRRIYSFAVKKHVKKMLLDKWIQSGRRVPPICFDEYGCLTEGQQRLTAIVESGKLIIFKCLLKCNPITDRDDEIGDLPDIQKWNGADRLKASLDRNVKYVTEYGKIKRYSEVSSVVHFIYSYLTNEKEPSYKEVLAIIKYFRKSIRWGVENFGHNKMTKRTFSLTAIIFAHHYAINHGDKEAEEILNNNIHGLLTGEMIDGSLLELRKYLTRTMGRVRNGKAVPALCGDNQWMRFAKTLRAFQAIMTGEYLTKIKSPSNSNTLLFFFLELERENLSKKLKLQPLSFLKKKFNIK